ncbi:MAG TPA: glycine cleavage system protein GcvH [Geminicoccaceae bacterium]
MSDARYTKEHEWVRLGDDGIATVGISDHAQEQLGDIVFVELPEVGRQLASGDAMAVVESVKAASDIYAPVAGEVVETNGALDADPALVNSGAEAEGWFVKIRVDEPGALDQLMDGAAYRAYLATLD